MRINIYVNVLFKPTLAGGRNTPVTGEYYACPMIIYGKAYDCRLLLQGKTLKLGHLYEIPVTFLDKELVAPKLSIGTKVILWEGKEVAYGEITKVL